MFDIGNILSIVLNTAFDIRDAIDAGKERSLKDSIISLQLVATDDLSMETVNSYCKSLEVLYAMVIRGMLTIQDRSRLNSSPGSIFTSLPMLTPYDKVAFNKQLMAFASVKDSIFNKGESGNQALQAFAESFDMNLTAVENELKRISFEEVILKDGNSAAPTFVDITIAVTQFGGRAVEKTFSIGIQVDAKIVSNEEMMQFIVRRNLSMIDGVDGKTKSFWKRMKTKFSLNFRRAKQNNKEAKDNVVDKSLNSMMNSVKDVKKPFVCLLVGNITRDRLKEMNIDITNAKLVRHIYDRLPVMSIAIYDTYTDTITSSLLRDTYFTKNTAADYFSEISQYEKQLSELVRTQKIFG